MLFLTYFALVFKSFFRLVSFLPSAALNTLDLSQYYLLRYLRIFLLTGTLLVTNSEVLDAFLALGIVLVAYGLGRKGMRPLRFGFDSLSEEFVLSAGLGLVLLAGVAFLLGIFGLLYPTSFYGTIGLAFLAGFGEIKGLVRRVWHGSWLEPFQKGERSWSVHLAELFLMGYLFVFLSVAFVACHLPEIEFDPLIYHLTVPKLYLQQHRIADIPEILEAVFPKNIGMIYIYGLALHSQITVKFLNFWMGLLLLLGIYGFGRQHWSRLVGLAAATLLASTPIVFFELRSVYIDLPIALFCFLNLLALERWMADGGRKWLVLSAFFLGMAAGSKYNALFNVLAASALVGYHFLARRRFSLFQTGVKLALYGLLCLSSLLAWLYLTYRFTGDPLFPYLSGDPLFPFLKGLFHSERWETYNLPVVRSGGHRWGLPLSFTNVFKTLWQMHFDEKTFCGSLGPFYVLLVPLLAFVSKLHPVLKRMLAYSAIYLGLWLVTTQSNRYLIPVLPALSLVAAGALAGFLHAVGTLQKSLRSIAIAGLLLTAAYNLPFLFYLWWVPGKRYFTPVLGAFPESVFSDNYSPERYLSTYMGSLPAINFLNSLGNVRRVLYVGFRDGPPLFYANFPLVYNELNVYNRFIEEKDLSRLLELLRQHEVSHVLVEQKFGVEKLVSSPESVFANRHLRQIWNKNAVSVFEVHQIPLPLKEYEVVNYLIDRMMDSKILSHAGQAVYDPNNYRDVHRLFPEPRFCILTFDQFEVRFVARIPANALLRFGLGFKQNTTAFPYLGEILIRDASGVVHPVYSRRLHLTERFEDQHWNEEEVDLSRFSGQAVEIVFTCRAEGKVQHQNYPLAVPDGIVLWSEPQILVRNSDRLDLIENFDKFKILPATRKLDTQPKSYAFLVPFPEGAPSRKGLAIVAGGEARYDLLIPENARLNFQLDWPGCPEPGSSLEILFAAGGTLKRIDLKTPPDCQRSVRSPTEESISLAVFSGFRGTLIFRLNVPPSHPGPIRGQGVVFRNLVLDD